MAFYKRRVVVQDTPAMVSERQARNAAKVQLDAEIAYRFPDLGERSYSLDEMRDVLTFQSTRYDELVAHNLKNPGCVECAPGSCTGRCADNQDGRNV